MTGPDTPPTPDGQPAVSEAPSQPTMSWAARTRAATPPALTHLLDSLSAAEKLVLGGALVIIAVDVIFGILIRGYLIPDLVWAAAALTIALAFVQRRSPTVLPVPYRTLLVAVAGVGVLVAARHVVIDALHILRPPMGADPAFVVGFLGLVVGGSAMAMGVWRLLTGRD
jgi:hypothetical protein